MKVLDVLKMALQNLRKRISRTLMTASGVMIGTSSVILMISLGIGLNATFTSFMESMGDLRSINVYQSWNMRPAGPNTFVSTDDDYDGRIKTSDIEIMKKMSGVKSVKAFVQLPYDYFLIRSGDNVYNGSVYAVDFSALEEFGYKTKSGSLLKGKNPAGKIILGSRSAYSFLPYDDKEYFPESDEMGNPLEPPLVNVVGDLIEIHVRPPQKQSEPGEVAVDPIEEMMENSDLLYNSSNPFDETAVLEEDPMDYNTINAIFIDIDFARQLVEEAEELRTPEEIEQLNFDFDKFDSIDVRVEEVEQVLEVQNLIKGMGFEAYSMEDSRKSFSNFAMMIQLVLGGLAGISLFVAAIGISNTMVMAITERTKEIGVMKVIGCEIKDIRAIFLIESGAIGFIGGVTGLVGSLGLSVLMNKFLSGPIGEAMFGSGEMASKISIIPVWLALFALVFATMIGLISGFSPANKAVRISPLAAIKHN